MSVFSERNQFSTSLKMLSAVILHMTLSTVFAGEAQSNERKVVPSSYDYVDETVESESFKDLKRVKLIDGKTDKASRVIWSWHSVGSKKPIDINFQFLEPQAISKVRIHFSGGKKAYGIKRIALFGKNNTEKTIPLASRTYDVPLGESKGVSYFSVDIPIENTEKLSSVLLQVKGVSSVALTEVEFFTKSQVEKKAMSSNPFDHLGNSASTSTGLRIEEKDFNKDGNKDIVLENDYMLYVIEPVYGGVVNYAYDKLAKKSLVKYHDSSSWGGVFCDLIKRDGRSYKDWFNAPYHYKIIDKGPEKLSVKLWCDGRSGQNAMVSFEKIFTITANSTDLKADYWVKLSADNVTPMEFAFFSFSAFGSNNEDWQLFCPEQDGVKTSRKGTTTNLWSHHPSQGWSGLVTDSGTGVAIVDEYRRIAAHHFWPVSSDSSVETIFGQFPVDAGDSFFTTLYMVPFYGIGVPDGVSRDMVGKIDSKEKYEVAPTSLDLKLKPSQAGKYSIEVSQKLLPEGKWEKIFAETRSLSVRPETIAFPFTAKSKGTYVLKVNVGLNGQNILMMERQLVVGKPSGEFVMTSPCERIIPEGSKAKEVKLDFCSADYATPHVKWAPSYSAGAPSVLFLVQEGYGKFATREIVEIAQRFEMEPHSSLIPMADNKANYYILADHLWSLGPAGYLKHLKEMLDKDKKYDAIVICGNYWKLLKDSLKCNILDRIKDGAGLILLYPIETPPELEELMKIDETKRFKASWKKEQEHFITTGVPMEELPVSNIFDNKAKGEVIASANGKPLITVSKLGKGRVVAASWDGGPLSRKGYLYTYSSKGLLPKLSLIGDDGKTFDYWEYQLSLLAKMIYYAGMKTPDISGDSMKIEGDDLHMALRNSSNKDIKAVADITVRDKYYRQESSKKVSLNLTSGTNQIAVPLEKSSFGGIHFVDVRILTGEKTQWWGTSTFNVVSPARIASLALGKTVYKRSENAELSVMVSGKLPENAKIQTMGKDSYGRIFSQKTENVKLGENKIVIPLQDSIGPYLEIEALLILPENKVVSEKRISSTISENPDLNRFLIMAGWPEKLHKGNLFLVPHYYKMMMKNFGWNSTWTPKYLYEEEVPLMSKVGLPFVVSRAPHGTPGGKHPDTIQPGKGKHGLIRNPCVSNKEFLKKLADSHSDLSNGEEYGACLRAMSDEANSIGKWQGCFSEDCRREFRNWLKTQYPSLDALNREWDTSFKRWDEVEAKLDTELNRKKSIGPWLDHRTFNEWNFANAYKTINDGIKKSGTNSKILMCGTQETNNYNAYDWYRLCKQVKSYNSYCGEQSVMRRSFMKDYLNYVWLGYAKDLSFLRSRLMTSMFDDNAKGYALYAQVSINPDWTLHQTGKDLIELKKDFAEGQGELIMRSKSERPQVMFHYSPASIHVDCFHNLHNIYKAELAAAKEALKLTGNEYGYVAYAQLDTGVKALEGCKILFLPLSVALSDEEIKTIKTFVGEGGTVVADFMPGDWTRHGKKREENPLADLFGVKTNNSELKMESGVFNWTGSDSSGIDVTTIQVGLEVTNGKSLAIVKTKDNQRIPGVIVNKFGNGHAVLLGSNFLSTFGNWKEMKFSQKNKAITDHIVADTEELLKESGVEKRSPLLDKAGNIIPLTSIYRRTLGDMLLIAVIRQSSTEENNEKTASVLTLDKKYYVYKVLFDKPRFLGYTDKPEFETSTSTQTLLAILPYQVTGIDLKPNIDSAKQGDSVDLSIALETSPAKKGNQHVVYIKVIDPTGKVRKEYDHALSLVDGKGKFKIPFAINDPAGIWKITAIDVATNTKQTIEIDLKEIKGKELVK